MAVHQLLSKWTLLNHWFIFFKETKSSTKTLFGYFVYGFYAKQVSIHDRAQVVGWPPIRSFRKNSLTTTSKNNDEVDGKPGPAALFVKVSMDGAPYLRKVDLRSYSTYKELSSALEKMFSCFTLGEFLLFSCCVFVALPVKITSMNFICSHFIYCISVQYQVSVVRIVLQEEKF